MLSPRHTFVLFERPLKHECVSCPRSFLGMQCVTEDTVWLSVSVLSLCIQCIMRLDVLRHNYVLHTHMHKLVTSWPANRGMVRRYFLFGLYEPLK